MNSGYATSDTSSPTVSFSTLEVGSFLEYTLSTQLVVLWNYTLDNGLVVTRDGVSFREVLLTPALTNEIAITLDVVEEEVSGVFAMEVTYQGPSILGHFFDGAFLLSYSPTTGICTIRNGSLTGQTGILNLISRNAWSSEEFVISSLDRNVTAQQAPPGSSGSTCTVMGERQQCHVYDCSYYDSVDGEIRHSRDYDADSGLLVRASGHNVDRILFGLVNISYADYRLVLTDTNIDLGPAYSVEAALAMQGALLLSGAAVTVIICVMWRRRRSSSEASAVFTADTDESTPSEIKTSRQRMHPSLLAYRKHLVTVVIILLILASVMTLRLPFIEEPPPEEHVLFVTPSSDVDHALGYWRAGEFYLPAAPQGKENLVTIQAEILGWGVCPAPLQLVYGILEISEMTLDDFLGMNDTERDDLPTNGMYINEGASSSGSSGNVKSGSITYLWYYRFTAPYANETSCTLRASVTISLIIREVE